MTETAVLAAGSAFVFRRPNIDVMDLNASRDCSGAMKYWMAIPSRFEKRM